MNILFCGDSNIEDGLLISILSLLKNVDEELKVYLLTMRDPQGRRQPVRRQSAAYLDRMVRRKNPASFVRLIDVTDRFCADVPTANMDTRFTPYCMLRLFADQIDELPDKIMYLDTDVVCRQDPSGFYDQDMEGVELAGVLDYYGSWFFRNTWYRRDYLNSGVLLLNLGEIRRSGLFERCRALCRDEQMFMPDQSAMNRLSQRKRICPRRFNEQRILRDDTVFQHFTTSFRVFPWLHTLTVKPWQVDQVHEKLKLHEYDDILAAYQRLAQDMRSCA